MIDTSGSMRYVMKDDIPGLARGTGEDGGGSSGGGDMTQEDRRLAQFWTRMEMAKRALIQCVSRLEPGTLFNIVRFNSSADKYKGRAITASKSSRKAACRWVEDTPFKNGGATNTLQALEYAFSQDSETNTIYFLSDGLPSRDGVNPDPTGPILDRVFELNRFRKVRIHTFGFDERVYSTGRPDPDLKAANDWLRRLAEETGGSFSQLRVDTKYTPDDPYGRGKKAEGDVARRPAGQSAR